MFKTDGRQTSADYFWHVFLNAKRFLKFLSKVNDVNTLDTGFMLLCFVELSIDFVPLICLNNSDDDDDQTYTSCIPSRSLHKFNLYCTWGAVT